jgi:carboxypeptidase-like protein
MKNISKIIIISTLICFCFSSNSAAQNRKSIAGLVKDNDGKPLAYVNVYIQDSFDGAMSGEKGSFSFSTGQEGSITLVASFIGYEKSEQKINLNSDEIKNIEIVLENSVMSTNVIMVTASSYGTAEDNGVVMTSMDVITTPGGAADMFQSLKTLPGITQVSESAQLYVRGGDPNETITLLDQASLYHPFTYESAYGGLFSNINTETIKGMYFSSGGFSSKYGNVLSGVLELTTKNEPKVSKFLLGLSLASSDIYGQIPISNSNMGLRFSARQSYTKPIFWLNGGLDDFTVMPTSSDANITLSSKYSDTGRIKLFASIAKDGQGVNVKRPGYKDVFNGASNSNFINLQLTDILFNNTVLKTSISRTDYKSSWKLGILDLNRKDNGLKLRSDIETIISNSVKLLTGFDIEYRDVGFKGIIPAEDFDLRSDGNGEVIDAGFDVTRSGVYAELEISKLFGLSDLYFIGGLRGDMVSPLALKWIDPRISFGYRITDKLTLNLGGGIFHQHPDPRLYSSSDGNPNLKSMDATHYIASLDYKINKVSSARIEGYQKDYRNLPLEDEKLNYNNNGYGFARGIDFMIKGDLFGIIDGWLSYGFINTKRKWMDFESLSSSSFDITHNFTVISKYNFTPSFQVGINYKYATGRPFDPVIGSNIIPDLSIYEPVYGNKNSARYPTYQRLDLRLTYLTRLFDDYFTVFYVEGLNILDINNIFGYSYNADYSRRLSVDSYFGKRTIVVGTRLSF